MKQNVIDIKDIVIKFKILPINFYVITLISEITAANAKGQ